MLLGFYPEASIYYAELDTGSSAFLPSLPQHIVSFDLHISLECELHAVPNKIIENLVQPLRICVEPGRDLLIDFILKVNASDLCPLEKP